MSAAIELALSRIRANIPRQIRDLAFNSARKDPFLLNVETEDYNIIRNVIHKVVAVDCKYNTGKQTNIVLLNKYREETIPDAGMTHITGGMYAIYRIPLEARDYRDIVDVSHVSYPKTYSGYGSITARSLRQVAKNVALNTLHSFGNSDVLDVPEIILIGPNMVKLTPGHSNHIDWILSATLAYDDEFNMLNQASLNVFADLCVIATKRYIYNELIIDLDAGFIQGGAELSSIKNIIEKWSDLDQDYTTILDRLLVSGYFDPDRVRPLFKYMI